MPSKMPHTNGNEPTGHGANGTKDVEMKDDASSTLKGGKAKKTREGDDEMTVVVPPSKGSKLSATPSRSSGNDGGMVLDNEAPQTDDTKAGVKQVSANTVDGRFVMLATRQN